jgi:hypothetical protein
MPAKPNIKEAVKNPTYYGGVDNPYEVIKVCEAWGLDKDAYLFNVAIHSKSRQKRPSKGIRRFKESSILPQ